MFVNILTYLKNKVNNLRRPATEIRFQDGRRFPVHIVPAAALKKRQCLARFFTSLAPAVLFSKRKRAVKGTICTGDRLPS